MPPDDGRTGRSRGGAYCKGEAMKTALARTASTVPIEQTRVMTAGALSRNLWCARASKPYPAKPPAVLTMTSVMSELPMPKMYWVTSVDRLAPATVPAVFHHAHHGARSPR